MNPKKRWRFEFTEPERRIFRRRRPLKVSQWAEKYRILNRGPRKGPWSNALTPYLIKPMDVWNDPWVRKTNMRFAPQTGKTQCALNCLMYVCDYDPDAALYVMPDEKVAKRLTKRQIIPAFRSSPRIAELLSRRVDDTTTTHVVFRNGMELMLAWATSAAELASESIRYVFMDEPEKYPAMAGREGDPIYLAEVRTRAYPDTKKIMTFSSPNEEKGAIMRLESEADEFWQYKAVCPYCGHVQIMTFEQIVFPEDCRDPRVIKRKKLARYQCENCPMDWDDLTRNQAVRDGLESGDMGWHCEQPVNRPQAVAFHLPSWYSPFVSLSEVAADFLSMREKGPDKFKLFVTQHKAEPWKMVVEKSTETQVLKARTDLMPQLVPPEAVALVAGIDNQLRGKWFVVRAFARDFTSWLIHYGFLAGWQDVETLLFETRYPTEGNPNRRLPIWRAAIDTGGGKKYADASMTEEAYMWIRQNGIGRGCRVYATKGASNPLIGKLIAGKPLDKTPSGRPLPGGLQLIRLDTDKLKDMFHYRLRQATDHGAFAAYLHKQTGRDYARQITAEEKQRNKKGVETWVPTRKDNHLLDCECLAHILVDPEWPGGGLNIFARTPRKQAQVKVSARVQRR